jgi:hypothetical protein
MLYRSVDSQRWDGVTVAGTLGANAREVAAHIMRGHPRLAHLATVVARAEALSSTVPKPTVDSLIASAWLHDIGYAPALQQTNFHPLDGALFLRREGWPKAVCDLVAPMRSRPPTTPPGRMVRWLDSLSACTRNRFGTAPIHQVPAPTPNAMTTSEPPLHG